MTNLTWRLKDLPTVEEVKEMIAANIITKDEARSIFFKDGDKPSATDLQDIKDELALLRKMIVNMPTHTTIYKEIERFRDRPFYEPYRIWCQAQNNVNALAQSQLAPYMQNAVNLAKSEMKATLMASNNTQAIS